MKRIAIAVLLLAGCPTRPAPHGGSGSAPPQGSGDTGSGSATQPPPPPPPVGGPGIGEKCGAGDACAAGLECAKYYGIAGARGPEFKTCEKRCKTDGECTDGRHCSTIADGPGQVCR